jgi:hypothetical protein
MRLNGAVVSYRLLKKAKWELKRVSHSARTRHGWLSTWIIPPHRKRIKKKNRRQFECSTCNGRADRLPARWTRSSLSHIRLTHCLLLFLFCQPLIEELLSPVPREYNKGAGCTNQSLSVIKLFLFRIDKLALILESLLIKLYKRFRCACNNWK